VQRWVDLLAVDGAARTTVADPDPTTGAERGQVVRRWVDGAGGANWGRSASRLDAGRRRLGEQLEAEDMLTMELLGEPARVGGREGGGGAADGVVLLLEPRVVGVGGRKLAVIPCWRMKIGEKGCSIRSRDKSKYL
jgi:hypothetical protein